MRNQDLHTTLNNKVDFGAHPTLKILRAIKLAHKETRDGESINNIQICKHQGIPQRFSMCLQTMACGQPL